MTQPYFFIVSCVREERSESFLVLMVGDDVEVGAIGFFFIFSFFPRESFFAMYVCNTAVCTIADRCEIMAVRPLGTRQQSNLATLETGGGADSAAVPEVLFT